MSDIRYGKPNMNNLPYELGKAIFKEMDNAPKTDHDALNKRAELLEKKIIEDRQRELHEK